MESAVERIRVQLEGADASARLTVSDSGIGIAPDFLALVFDRFRQADAGAARTHRGLGLGLAIVRHVVDAHGGGVLADSAGVGHGATFHRHVAAWRDGGAYREAFRRGFDRHIVKPIDPERVAQTVPEILEAGAR